MIDLTKNTTPFGLLDIKTQQDFVNAEANGEVIQYWNSQTGWLDCPPHGPAWAKVCVYRVKPRPELVKKYLNKTDSGDWHVENNMWPFSTHKLTFNVDDKGNPYNFQCERIK